MRRHRISGYGGFAGTDWSGGKPGAPIGARPAAGKRSKAEGGGSKPASGQGGASGVKKAGPAQNPAIFASMHNFMTEDLQQHPYLEADGNEGQDVKIRKGGIAKKLRGLN